MLIFLFHLLILVAGFLLLGKLCEAVTHHPRATPQGASWLGAAVLVLWPLAWGLMLSGGMTVNLPVPPLRDPLSTLLSRAGEYRLGAAVGLAVLFWAGWSTFSLLRDGLHLKGLQRSALDLGALADPAWRNLADLRLRLEAKYRVRTGRSNLCLLISEGVLSPFTIGMVRPDLYAPLWMFSERGGVHLRLLLDREAMVAGRWRGAVLSALAVLSRLLPFARPLLRSLKLALDGRADRIFLEQLPQEDRHRFVEALRQSLAAGRDRDADLPFGRDPRAIRARIRFAQGDAPERGAVSWVLGLPILLLVPLMGLLGPVPFRSMHSLMSRELPPGVIFLPYSREARAVSIPGRGGDLRDGILVDTTRVRDSRCHLDLPYWAGRSDIQGGGPPAFLKVSFDFEAIPTRPGVQGVLLNGYVTLNREDADGQVRRTLALDEDIRLLPPGRSRQTMVLALGMPGPFAGWRGHSGPSFRIPPGWRVRVTNLRAEAASPRDWTPRDFGAGYRLLEDWRRGVGACHTLNLQWRDNP